MSSNSIRNKRSRRGGGGGEDDDKHCRHQTKNKHKNKKSKRQMKKEQQAAADYEEEQRLTSLLFGGGGGSGSGSGSGRSERRYQRQQQQRHAEEEEEEEEEPLFEIDREGEDHPSSLHEQEEEEEEDGDDDEGGDEGGDATQTDNNKKERRQQFDEDDDNDNDINEGRGTSAAWIDDDDEQLQIDLLGTNRLRKLRKSRSEPNASSMRGNEVEQRLRQKFQSTTQLTARTDWANINNIEEDDEEEKKTDHHASTSEPLLVGSGSSATTGQSSSSLPSTIINMIRCQDANITDPNQSVVQSVHFHPGSSNPDKPLLLTAGLDKTLRFFHVDSESSTKVHGIHFPKLPIYTASFLGTTGKVVVSGRRSFFYIYDAGSGALDLIPKIVGREERSLEKFCASNDERTIAFMGNDGYIILYDCIQKHWITDLKMNGSVRALTFSSDGQQLLGSGSDGDVYRWDLRTRRCIERFANEDGTITSSLAISTRSQHLAVGAESGVVNLYSEQQLGQQRSSSLLRRRTGGSGTGPTVSPIKSIMNLRTSADSVKFNHDGQILAMSSKREKHGLKLVHVPTATVFSNWPTSKTPLSYVWSMDFSPQSKFLAVGNDKGKCLLYKIQHYYDQQD